VTGVPHQTVWKVLHRAGCSRRPKPPREATNRYEWPCPGDLLHMDTKRYMRFTRPGYAVTGDRTRSGAQLRERVGHEYAHAIIDDHTRLAYSELHPDERADTVVSFTQRALAWYAQHGIAPKRVMTDNAWTYTHSQRLKELLAANHVTHLTIKPHRPQTNGKIERFHQTMAREWGYGLTYLSSTHRAEALPHWLNHYNQHRPHSAIGNRPPISRVRNV
jgi:transposase InsO family protein